jgi:hypothetical protein
VTSCWELLVELNFDVTELEVVASKGFPKVGEGELWRASF